MTPNDGVLPMGGSFQMLSWPRSIGYKWPLIVMSLLLVVVVWQSPAASLFSYSQISASQIETFLSIPNGGQDYNSPSNNTSSSEGNNDFDHHESIHTTQPPKSSSAEEESVPKEQDSEKAPSLLNDNSAPSKPTTDPRTSPPEAAFSDIEDSQLVDSEKETVPQEDVQRPVEETKYIMPLLSYQVGTGNQLMEYKSAAVIARTLNRTLCLVPFFGGPDRHFGYLGNRHVGNYLEDRYDTEVLSQFVKVASMKECVGQCDRRLDSFWRLKNSRPPHWNAYQFNDTPRFSVDFTRQASKWSTTADVAATLGPRNDPKCVALGGLFPGLRWRGVLYATSLYMPHSKIITKAADFFQARALGSIDANFLAGRYLFPPHLLFSCHEYIGGSRSRIAEGM